MCPEFVARISELPLIGCVRSSCADSQNGSGMSETFGFQLLLACKSHRMQSPVVRRCLPCMQVTPHVLVLDHRRKRLAPLTPLYNAVAEIKNCKVAKQTVMSQGSTPSKQNHTEQLSCKQHSGKFAISPKGSYLLLDSARRDRAKDGAAGGGCSGRPRNTLMERC